MRIVPALLILLSLHPALASEADWEEISRTDEITLFRKEVPGSPVLAYKATAKIDAPMAKVVGVVRDTARLPEWSYRLKHAEIVEEISPTERIEYVQASPPWPVKDRDLLYRSKATYDRASRTVSLCMESTDDARRKETSERVRAQVFPSCFRFMPLEGGAKTRIEAEIHGDPKGSIPKWVVNLVQKRAPVTSMKNLKARLQAPGIQDDPQTLELLKNR